MTAAPPILLLAAGASARMGRRDKLMEPIRGEALIRERAREALASGAPVVVALPPRTVAPDRWAALGGLPLAQVTVADPALGLAASLATGIGALPRACRGVLVMLADMPEITAADLVTLRAGWDGETIHRAAAADGKPGNPVLFAARDLPALAAFKGDTGARDYLRAQAERVRLIALPKAHALTDLDTPDDWARWRQERDDG